MQVARKIGGFLWQYLSEFVILLAAILLAFVDAELLSGNPYYVLAGGIVIAGASAFSKIRGSLKMDRFLSETAKANRITEQAQDLLQKKQAEDDKARQNLREQADFIGRLIKKGLIAEQSIFEIVHRDRFLFLFCYQNVPDQERVQRSLGRDFRNPSLDAIEQLGFVRVGSRHNLYAIPYNMLPTELRNPAKVEKVIRKLVKEHWDAFLLKFENTRRQSYNRYVAAHPDPMNCTYMMVSANFHDFGLHRLQLIQQGIQGFASIQRRHQKVAEGNT